MGFPDATGDQLGVLGTEIEDQDFLTVDISIHIVFHPHE
jgi:hypothetical protein